jgi:cell division protein FtsN
MKVPIHEDHGGRAGYRAERTARRRDTRRRGDATQNVAVAVAVAVVIAIVIAALLAQGGTATRVPRASAAGTGWPASPPGSTAAALTRPVPERSF